MIAISANRLVLQAEAKRVEARARYDEALSAPVRAGSSYRIREAREQLRYWERKVAEMRQRG